MVGEGERGASAEELRRLRERVAELERRSAGYRGREEPLAGSEHAVTIGEREELLVEVERLAQIGSWFWNVETNGVHWSDGLYRILGRDPLGERGSFEGFFGAVHPDDVERIRDAGRRIVDEGRPDETNFRIVRPSGEIRHLTMSSTRLYDAAGKLRRVVGACVDVTDAREAKTHLERSAAELEEAQAVASVGSWVLDAETGAVSWSAQLRRVLDVGPDLEPSMFELFEHVAAGDRARMRDLHERILAGSVEGETEVVVPTRRGARVIKAREVAQRDPEGRLRFARGTLADVTDQRSIAAQVAHGQKMEAVGRLAGGVAHDLNNHLMVIQGNLHLLRLARSEELDALLGAVESARQTAARLLAFGRKSTLRRQRVDANELVRQSVLLLSRVLSADTTLVVDAAPDLAAIDADASLFGQCLVNLVLNARDAIARGGRIVVRTSADGAGFVVIEVRDDGEGMDDATRARAFEPFFTTKAVGMGSGLGLSMVQGTLEQHGGTVTLESKRGRGTVVTMRWPLATSSRPDEEPRSPIETRRRVATVLVVEDQPALGRMVQRLLEADGHRVLLARLPSEAIALAQLSRDVIDVVLTDVVMPEMRGPALIEELCAHLRPRPAAIYMSGHPVEDVDLGADVPLLRKPFTLEALRAAVVLALGS